MNPTYLFLLLSLIGSSFQLIPTITCPIPLLLPPGTYCYDSSNIGNINSLPPSGVTTVIFAQSLPPYTLTRNIRATNLVIDAQSFTIKSNINVGVMEIGDAPLYPTISLSFDGASVIATSLDIYFRGSLMRFNNSTITSTDYSLDIACTNRPTCFSIINSTVAGSGNIEVNSGTLLTGADGIALTISNSRINSTNDLSFVVSSFPSAIVGVVFSSDCILDGSAGPLSFASSSGSSHSLIFDGNGRTRIRGEVSFQGTALGSVGVACENSHSLELQSAISTIDSSSSGTSIFFDCTVSAQQSQFTVTGISAFDTPFRISNVASAGTVSQSTVVYEGNYIGALLPASAVIIDSDTKLFNGDVESTFTIIGRISTITAFGGIGVEINSLVVGFLSSVNVQGSVFCTSNLAPCLGIQVDRLDTLGLVQLDGEVGTLVAVGSINAGVYFASGGSSTTGGIFVYGTSPRVGVFVEHAINTPIVVMTGSGDLTSGCQVNERIFSEQIDIDCNSVLGTGAIIAAPLISHQVSVRGFSLQTGAYFYAAALEYSSLTQVTLVFEGNSASVINASLVLAGQLELSASSNIVTLQGNRIYSAGGIVGTGNVQVKGEFIFADDIVLIESTLLLNGTVQSETVSEGIELTESNLVTFNYDYFVGYLIVTSSNSNCSLFGNLYVDSLTRLNCKDPVGPFLVNLYCPSIELTGNLDNTRINSYVSDLQVEEFQGNALFVENLVNSRTVVDMLLTTITTLNVVNSDVDASNSVFGSASFGNSFLTVQATLTNSLVFNNGVVTGSMSATQGTFRASTLVPDPSLIFTLFTLNGTNRLSVDYSEQTFIQYNQLVAIASASVELEVTVGDTQDIPSSSDIIKHTGTIPPVLTYDSQTIGNGDTVASTSAYEFSVNFQSDKVSLGEPVPTAVPIPSASPQSSLFSIPSIPAIPSIPSIFPSLNPVPTLPSLTPFPSIPPLPSIPSFSITIPLPTRSPSLGSSPSASTTGTFSASSSKTEFASQTPSFGASSSSSPSVFVTTSTTFSETNTPESSAASSGSTPALTVTRSSASTLSPSSSASVSSFPTASSTFLPSSTTESSVASTINEPTMLGPTAPPSIFVIPSVIPNPNNNPIFEPITPSRSSTPMPTASSGLQVEIGDCSEFDVLVPIVSNTVNLYCNELPYLVITPRNNGLENVVVKNPDPELSFIIESELNNLASPVVDISVTGSLRGSVEICLSATRSISDNSCLGYIDESKNPPKWVCEDKCLQKSNGLICGETNHFTNFAILLGGDGSGNKDCSDGKDYVTGSVKGDVILISSCIGLLIVLGAIFIFLASFSKSARLMFYGQEGTRIKNLRRYSEAEVVVMEPVM